jgi:phosphate transport system substrate-binding protein
MKTNSLTVGFCALAAATGLAARAGTITVKGSDTLVILAQKWAEVHMQKRPETKIQVSGGGSGVGFAALQNRNTDLADASRKIKAKEIEACVKAFGKRPTEYKVALDGLSVYVNKENPLDVLSVEELGDIFTGRIRNWKELGGPEAPIVLVSRENSSGTYEFFKEHVLKGKDFAASAQTMPGTAAVLEAVSRDKNAIGYGGAAYGAGAKHLRISKLKGGQAIEPTEETVLKGEYPIWRYLYIYVNPEQDRGEIAAYLNWIRGEEGQKLVQDVGYYPLPEYLRQK